MSLAFPFLIISRAVRLGRMAPDFLMDKPPRLCYDKSKLFLF